MNAPPQSPAHAAVEIVKTLRSAGHVALLAGGCVRDMLLGRQPDDYDVATDAHPEQVTRLFPKTRLVGAKFGVVLVRKFGHDIEVATFRADGPYSDGRHPDTVIYGTEVEDARRRDFTINGLFYDPIDDRVIDHVDGRKDLEARVIRTIGDPDRRLTEDHLRMLRAVRFSARLQFPIEPRTAQAIRSHAPRLRAISPERIWMELELILADPSRATAWELLATLGLVEHLTVEWRPTVAQIDAVARRLAALADEPVSPHLALAVVLRAESPARIEEIGRAMRLSNKLIETTAWLVRSLATLLDEGRLELADLKTLMAPAAWPELLELLRVECATNAAAPIGLYERVRDRAARIEPDRIAPPPLLTGDDLSSMGLAPGPRFGEILKAVYRAQLNEQIATPEQARQLAERLIADDSSPK